VAPHRARPLNIDDLPDQLAMSSAVSLAPAGGAGSGSAAAADERQDRLAAGLRALRGRVASLRFDERALMLLGGILAPVGLALVLLGWYGAARTPYVFEQVPYLISGGLLGLALAFVGGFLYFAHWMTAVVKEQRAQSAAVVAALRSLQEELRGASAVAPAPALPALVATRHGSMAHRADCAVVAGKSDLRSVSADAGLAPCRLCEPY
jgi:hypothetical protein